MPEVLDAGFSAQDVYESTAHGMLWIIAKVQHNGDRWGLYRMRRNGPNRLAITGELVWKKRWGAFANTAQKGQLLFRSHAGTDVLIDLTNQ